MFSLFEKEILKARPYEGEGAGGQRHGNKKRKVSRQNRKKRTIQDDGNPEGGVAKSFSDLDKLIQQKEASSSDDRNTEQKKHIAETDIFKEVTQDVAERIVQKSKGPFLTSDDLRYIHTKTKTSDEKIPKQINTKEVNIQPKLIDFFTSEDISVLKKEEGGWKKLTEIKKIINQTAQQNGATKAEIDALFQEYINPIANKIGDELRGDKNPEKIDALHRQFLRHTKDFLEKKPASSIAPQTSSKIQKSEKKGQANQKNTQKTSEVSTQEELTESPLVQKIMDENPQMYGHKGDINVRVGGGFNGSLGHGSKVDGNIAMKNGIDETLVENTAQKKQPDVQQKQHPISLEGENSQKSPLESQQQEKKEKTNENTQVPPLSQQEFNKIKTQKKDARAAEAFAANERSQADYGQEEMDAYEAGYVKTQETKKYKKGKKKGEEYTIEKWVKNKVNPLENISNFSQDITHHIELYRQKLGYGDDTIDKQRGTPRYRALLAVNQMMLDNGKLEKALREGADESVLKNIQERITKNKQKVEEILHIPETQWDSIDDLQGADVYKNMTQQLATAQYDVARLLTNTPEVANTPEYKVYTQFVEKISPLLKDEESVRTHYTILRTTLDSISRQVRALQDTYATTNNIPDNKDSKNENSINTERASWKVGDEVMIPRTDGSVSQAKIVLHYGDGQMLVQWEEDGKHLEKIVTTKQIFPVVEDKQVADTVLDSTLNREIAQDAPGGLFAWGENQYTLFGMQIPHAGSDAVFGVRAFKQALRLLEDRILSKVQQDPRKRKQYNEIVQIVSHVPDSGLTQEEVERLQVLTQSLAMPESLLQLDTGRTIDQMYAEVEKRVQNKLPTLATKHKKRGFFGRLAHAAVSSLPFIATASALDDASAPRTVDAMTNAPVLGDTAGTADMSDATARVTSRSDSGIRKNVPTAPEEPSSESIASIPMSDVTEMVIDSSDISLHVQDNTPTDAESIEQLKEYTVQKGDNLTFIIEGKAKGQEMLPALKVVPEAQRQHILNHVITALRYSPQKQKEIGVTSGNIDLIYPGDTINIQVLNELISQVSKDQGVVMHTN